MANDLTGLSDKVSGQRRALATARLVPQEKLDRQNYRRGDFWLGRTLSGRPFGWQEDMNLLTCAGPRCGKGVGVVVPNLLEFPGSAVVVDPKGELATLTAAYRRDKLGQKVIVLDPARVAKVPEELRGRYNPLAQLDPDDSKSVSAAQSIASGIVVPQVEASKDQFWDRNALTFIQALILYMLQNYPPEERTLMRLRQTASVGDWALFEHYLKHMREDDPAFEAPPKRAFEMLIEEMFASEAYGGVIREAGAAIAEMGDQTRGSVLATVRDHLSFLNEPQLWDSLSNSDDPDRTFSLADLRSQDRFTTVYLCLPVDMMYQQGRWLRLILSQVIQYIERTGNDFDKREHWPVLMMIDEFFQLGPMPSIVNTLTYAPGFGLRLWLIIQDLNQLKANYPKSWETILGACGIKQFFGINDLTTAKYVSDLLGEAEVDVPSITLTQTISDAEGTNQARTVGSNRSRTEGDNWSESTTVTEGTTIGTSTSVAEGTSASFGTNSSQSSNQGQSVNEGWNRGSSNGSSDSYARNSDPGSIYGTQTRGTNSGTSAGVSGGVSASSGTSQSRGSSAQFGTSRTVTHGTSFAQTSSVAKGSTVGGSVSDTVGTNESVTEGSSQTRTDGRNYGFTVTKQARKLYRPEELLLAFTKENLTQIAYVRDQGGMLLFRTPYYADPYFQMLTSESKNDPEASS